MKKWKKIVTSSMLALGLVAGLAGCGGGDSSKAKSSSDSGKTVKLTMYEIGQAPKNWDALQKEVNKTIKKEAGAEIDVKFIDYGDYQKKMSVIVSSGEDYDIAYADNYVINAQKGAYADLTKLLPKYAKDSYDQLDKAYIEGNKIDGKLYAFPVNANVYSQQVFSFDKTLLDKYNLSVDGIKDYADLEPLLEVIAKNEPEIAPIATGPKYKIYENVDFVLNADLPFVVRTDGDTSKIENFYDMPEAQEDLKTMHDFYQKGFVPKDAATSKVTYVLGDKSWFVRCETQGPFDYGDTILTNAAGREIVSVPITDKVKKLSNAMMANFVVSSTSKHQKEAVKALNVINSNPDVLNTLVYGIKGEAWEKNDDGTAKLLDGYKPNYHMQAWNIGNNLAVYPTEGTTKDQITARDQNIADATESPLLGFNFDQENVKTEITNISNVMSKYQLGLTTGTLDPDEAISEMDKELESAGMDKVMKEMQKQYDAFLKDK